MAFQLAPYNNAMRLGQGFNSYTQQICIDDAVIIDPGRAENVLTNDGSTMRIMVQSMGKPSAWSRQTEIVVDDRDKHVEAIEDEGKPSKETAAGTKKIKLIEGKNASPGSADSDSSKLTKPASADANAKAEISKSHHEDSEASKQESQDQTQAEEKNQDDEKNTDEAHDESDSALTPPEDEAEGEHEEAPTKVEGSKRASESDEKSHATSTSGKSPSKPSADAVKAGEDTTEKDTGAKDTKGTKQRSGASSADKKGNATPRKRAVSAGSKSAPQIKSEKDEHSELATRAMKSKDLVGSPDEVDWTTYTSQGSSRQSDKEKEELMAAEKERVLEEKQLRREREKEMKEAEKERKEEEKRRRAETKQLVEWGASTVGYTKEDLEAMKHNIKFEERFTGMLENKKDFDFDATLAKGPSQIVTYTSRFVDKLSDITDDMNISGSLSIKAGKIGGSGKGAFIDSDKFKSSDLNFYISVKVVNQTINFKDALQYNPLRSVNKDNFREVYGDSFISGFQEGGEFNAVVSMKILNKAKKTDIKAEAKIAFTAGTVDLKAEANVNIAKANIETNTETTIQVTWSGGGHIKPREQQWDIQSLMQAAARFPDLVAECPQRTYAIITKYDTLRSFVKLQPAAYTKLQYENAQLYTNAMMDSYMSYKSLYTKLGSYIFDAQSKTKVIKSWPEEQTDAMVSTKDVKEVATRKGPIPDNRFAASIGGLEDAKKAIRRQMAIIVNEVDVIEHDPKLATDDDHPEPYQSAAAFEERIPKVETPEKPKSTAPLGGRRIMAKTQTEAELDAEAEEESATTMESLIADPDGLSLDETGALDALKEQRPTLGKNLRVTAPLGSQTNGSAFNNLEFLQPEWSMTAIQVEIADGALAAFWLHYDNGLILSRGKTRGGKRVEMTNFSTGERIIAATIQSGKGPKDAEEARVISLHLYTNRGRSLVAQAADCLPLGEKKHSRDGVVYTDVVIKCYDTPLKDGNVKGLWGRSDDTGIWRLGLIWEISTRYVALVARCVRRLHFDQVHEGIAQGDTGTIDPITAASTGMAVAQQDLQKITAQYTDLKAQYASAQQTIQTANSKASLAEADANEQKRVRNDLDRAAVTWGGRSPAYRNDRVQIHFIEYGGKLIWNDNVARRLISYAENQVDFSWNDPVFDEDPWPGFHKSGAVVYRYNNTGEMRCLVRKQNENARFDSF